MSLKFSILSLGSRNDADQFHSQRTSQLSGSALADVRKLEPSLDELRALFKSSPEWVYLAAHFRTQYSKFKGDKASYINVLHNETNGDEENPSIKIEFLEDQVAINHKGNKVELKKGTDFLLDKNINGVFWGGCSVRTNDTTWDHISKLFGKTPVYIGWKGKTGWQMPHIIMGGTVGDGKHDKPAKDFFERVKITDKSASKIKDSWLEPAAPLNWSGLEGNFNVRYFEANKAKEFSIKDKKVIQIR